MANADRARGARRMANRPPEKLLQAQVSHRLSATDGPGADGANV